MKKEQILMEIEMARNALDRAEGLVNDDRDELTGMVRPVLVEPRKHRVRRGTRYTQRKDWGPIIGYQGRIAVHKDILAELLIMILERDSITIRNARSVMRRFTTGPKAYLSSLAYAHLRELEKNGTIVHLGTHYYAD